MVRIFLNNTPLDLSDSPALSIELQSPIWGEQGTQTIPVTIPATPHNRRLLGNPGRIDLGAMLPKYPVRVEDGSFVADGLLCVLDASRDGIEVNIGLNNSVAYAEWKGRRLSELEVLKSTSVPVPDSPDEFDCATDSPLCMFPVVVSYTENAKDENKNKEGSAGVILNVLREGWEQSKSVERVVSGEIYNVKVPKRYGWSPFLKVWRLLELIFQEIGITLAREDNPFYSGRIDLRRLVVLNNCADACCLESIAMADIVPDCTVMEFLESLWAKFGFVWHIDINSGAVSAAFVEDVIEREPTLTIDGLLAAFPSVTFEAQKYLKLIPKTSLTFAEPPSARYDDFMQGRVVSFVEGIEDDHTTDERLIDCARDLGIEFDDEGLHGKFTGINLTNGGCYIGEQYPYRSVRFGSLFFTWDPKPDGLEAHELEAGDESVAMSQGWFTFGDKYSKRLPWFTCGLSHRHSALVGSGVEEGDGSGAPIAFVFAYQKNGENFGAVAPIDPDGRRITETDDGAEVEGLTLYYDFRDGIFRNFWRNFDLLLRHGARTVDAIAEFGRADLGKLSPLEPVRLLNVYGLIESASYSLTGTSPVETSLKLRPLTLRGDFDAEAEQAAAPIEAAQTRPGYVLSLDSLWLAIGDSDAIQDAVKKKFEEEHPREGLNPYEVLQDQDLQLYAFRWLGFSDPDALPDPEDYDPDEDPDERFSGMVEARFAVTPRYSNGGGFTSDEEFEVIVTGEVGNLRPKVRMIGG